MTACDNRVAYRNAWIKVLATGEFLVFQFMPSEWAVEKSGWYNGGYGLFCLGKGYDKPMLLKKSWKHLLKNPDLSRVRALCEKMGWLVSPHAAGMAVGDIYMIEGAMSAEMAENIGGFDLALVKADLSELKF